MVTRVSVSKPHTSVFNTCLHTCIPIYVTVHRRRMVCTADYTYVSEDGESDENAFEVAIKW